MNALLRESHHYQSHDSSHSPPQKSVYGRQAYTQVMTLFF